MENERMMEYQAIGRADHAIFWELLNAYYRDGEDADTEQAVLDGFIQDLFAMVMEGRIDGCFLALDGVPAGFVLWMLDREGGMFSELPGWGTFLEIGICPPFRGKGYGYQTVTHIEQQMKQAGVEHFYVSVYPLADGFWTKCGYVKTGDRASNGLYIYKK